jgi:hypothetical protein
MAIAPFIPLIGKALDRLFPDPEKANEAKLKLFELQQEGQLAELDADLKLALGQIEVNKAEAQHPNVFIAGWRPFVGWVSGVSVAWNFIAYPTVTWFGVDAPALDTSQLMVLLLGMLGLGGMRSLDKRNRVDTKEMK